MSSTGCAGVDTQRKNAVSCRVKPESVGSPQASLAAIIRHYLVHYQPEHEHELTRFRNQGSLEDAIGLAARAEDEQGHRYSHQRRIKSRAIAEASRVLADAHDDLQRCSSFHELWSLIGSYLTPIEGVRELYTYDTAVRLGAHLCLSPERVYLHAGTRIGAKNLGLLSRTNAHEQWLELSELPAPLRKLPASDVENLLCIYKAELARVRTTR